MPSSRKTLKIGFNAIILGALLSAIAVAAAAAENKKPASTPAPAKPAATSRPAPSSRPSGNSGGGATHGPSAAGPSASHPASSGPSANHPATSGPTAGGAGVRPSTNNTAIGARGFNAGGAGAHASVAPHNAAIRTPPSRGSSERVTSNGSVVRMRSNGRPSDVHDARRGMDVHQGLNGGRRIVAEHADHSRAVFQRGRPGYVQRPYSFHGHDFARRTYFYHGQMYSHFYHGYGFRGLYLNVYAPGFYFAPGFYGWAYNPWRAPIVFGWGWGASPWYGYYGYYFAPYPAYPSASYWLTDYMISSDLQSAYAAHAEAGEMDGAPPAMAGPPELTPDVKQQIADEVRNQLALENQEAQQNAQQQDIDPGSSGLGRMLDDAARGKQHVFVVGTALDVVDANQAECALSDGDVLALETAPPADATTAELVVLSSKGGVECAKQDTVAISLDDLQEMQNHMRETIDQGLQELQKKQGKSGLPAAPVAPQMQPALYVSIAPPQDPSVATELQQESQLGDQAEQDVTGAVAPTGEMPPHTAPIASASVTLGQTISQVEGMLGQPNSKALLGPKVIYNYNGMKIIFKDGKVADVQ